MSLWVDKYRPCSFARLDYHKEQVAQLSNLVSRPGRRRPARSAGQTSTPNSVTGQEQRLNTVATLTLQLQMMTQERDELRGILANYTNKDLNNRLNFELEMLNMEHKKVMLDLQKFPMEMREALKKCKELTEETVSYSILHNQLLSERTQLKKKVSMLREENQKLWREQISLQVACEKVKNLYEKTDEKFCELCDEGDKKQDILVERQQSLLKLRDLVTKYIEMAEKLQNPFAVSQMSSALEN
ncbi:disks large homolog 5-like [Microtus pennsylvanicus]|uniref:disks large homolog 5-like n=1 Tax=Microtus pennsylvanicus TaxID=10058 RepID=UPI003F6D01DC